MKATKTIPCNKCDGKGHIEGFAHVANGICFQCKGSGVCVLKSGSISFARNHINQFRQSGFFPEALNVEKIKCLSFEGHATAEQWLMKNCEYYYIGQPVCRSSMWFKIPIDAFSEFSTNYNKVFQTQI